MRPAATGLLAEILAAKRDEVAARRAVRPTFSLSGTTRGFARALARGPHDPVRAIAEIKRKSPSAGAIRPGADPAAIARDYASHGAAALSVLTDERWFDGSIEFLARVRDAVAIPLLRKDFVVDAYQIAEARAAGADAVLLIVAAIPDDAQLRELLAAAHDHGLDALVEVHDEREAEAAIACGARVIGVNHRNLTTLAIDMSLTARIAPAIPNDTILVGESGIKTAADVRALGLAGAHAILVGESLMRAASPGAALAELLA
ncbi:MAG TPA: indole-3-glycerol phosphate synthase TrpC [Kofleriaceae bacterium]|nr:indole-3-glycerol phosphate synthase TrpC [Kofleriaceae bacterium]